ncbi:hypothetical protein AB1Y20_007609 [Prymnesium parvum]|uniref:Uncharacterized protein n=1 Tax=Prymnesium parvum TaxID=97485 RepID=A0AB34IY21_PRYPA
MALPGVTGDEPQARTLPGFGKSPARHDQDSRREKGSEKVTKAGTSKAQGGSNGGVTSGSWDDDEATAQREERLRSNPKKVFCYNNGQFSIKKTLFDWPGICKKFKWDPDKLCGPVTMNSTTIDKNRAHNCMDSNHRTTRVHDHWRGQPNPCFSGFS